MKTSLTRSALAIAAAIALSALALTGCTPGSPDKSTGGGTTQKTTAPSKTYSEQDLVDILNKTNTALQAGGTVNDLGLLAEAQSNKTKSLPQRIKEQGGTLTPVECGPLLDKTTNDLLTLGNNNGAYSATLTYGTTFLSATSSAKLGDPAVLDKLLAGDIDEMDAKCSDISFTLAHSAQLAPFHLTFKKQDVKTAAGIAHAYIEVTKAGAASVQTVTGVAVDGNLLIGFAGLSSTTTVDDLAKAVNAVHDAAE